MHARRHHTSTSVAALMVAVCSVVLAAVVGLSAGPASGTPEGVVFGAHPHVRSGEDKVKAAQRFEAAAGRSMGILRHYLAWDEPFTDPVYAWAKDTHHPLMLSLKPKHADGSPVLWADIATAQPGSATYASMVMWADRIRTYGAPMYFSFNHEPETGSNLDKGTAPEFIAAWRRIHDVFTERQVTNVKWIWIMTDYAFFVGSADRRDAAKWYPGDDYVDALGADAYNWYTCRPTAQIPWWTLEKIITPFRDFGRLHPDEELWLPEFGSTEDPNQPGRKAQWFSEAQALLKRPDFSQFVGVSYFDMVDAGCLWPTDTSASSQSAFNLMGADPFYATSPTWPSPQPVVSTTPSLTTEESADATAVPTAASSSPTEVLTTTSVVPSSSPTLSFVAAASANANKTTHTVTVPTSVQAGDTLLLFFSANATATTTTPPSSWTRVTGVDDSKNFRGVVWTKRATSTDAGSVVAVGNSAYVKADLTVAAYRSSAAGAGGLDVHGLTFDKSTTATHVAPSVTPTHAGDWAVVYVADKSGSNNRLTGPTSLLVRSGSTGAGGGHVTAVLTDSAGPLPLAPTGTSTFKGAAAGTKAVSYTVTLSAG